MRSRAGTVERSGDRRKVLCVACGFRFEESRARPGARVRCSACDTEVVVGSLHAVRRRQRRTATTSIPGEDPRTAAGCADVERSGRAALVLAAVLAIVGVFAASHFGLLPEPDPVAAERTTYCDRCVREAELEPPLRSR